MAHVIGALLELNSSTLSTAHDLVIAFGVLPTISWLNGFSTVAPALDGEASDVPGRIRGPHSPAARAPLRDRCRASLPEFLRCVVRAAVKVCTRPGRH